MADDSIIKNMQASRAELAEKAKDVDFLSPMEIAYHLSMRHADFHLFIISPTLSRKNLPSLVKPVALEEGGGNEFVYDILDYGDQLSTSKGDDATLSMCKLHYTIEKMIAILVDRLKENGIDENTEVQVALDGLISGQRKGFESIINLKYNVVVTNFDPGAWGEVYLDIVKTLSQHGLGFPSESPRTIYRHAPSEMKMK